MTSVILRSLVILALCITLCSCTNRPTETAQPKGEINFGFSLNERIEGDVSSVIVSLEDEEGNIIYYSHSIALYNMNGNYISEPLALFSGTYFLTQFLIIDDQNNVVYATPIAGSPLSYLVENPLPIEFNVTESTVATVVPEVLPSGGNNPEDFGYASFKFEIVETFDFLISVFIYDGESMILTEAEVTVTYDNTTLYSGTLDAATNNITLPDNYDEYSLVISKTGYTYYSQTFTNEEIKSYSQTPLIITLSNSENSVIEIQPGPEGKDALVWNLPPDTEYAQTTGRHMNVNEGFRNFFCAMTWTFWGDQASIRSFIEFDLSNIPQNCKIDSAFLYIYNDTPSTGENQSGENEFAVNRVTEPWDEHTIIWDNQPDVIETNSPQDQVIAPQSTATDQDYVVDITEMVRYWINNPQNNYGMRLKLTSEEIYSRAYFASSDHENPSIRPKLVITTTQ